MLRGILKRLFAPPDKIIQDPRITTILDKVSGADSILDIGCVQHDAEKAGDDYWLHSMLYDVTEDVVGLDYLEEDVEELNEEGYNVVCENAEEFDVEREFDVVVAGELIEHLSNPGMFLDSVRAHLGDDGRFVLSTPNPFCLYRILDSVTGEVTVNPEHTCYFDKMTLEQILDRHGFNIVDFQFVPSPRYTPAHSHMNILFVLHGLLHSVGLTGWGGLSMVVVAKRSDGAA